MIIIYLAYFFSFLFIGNVMTTLFFRFPRLISVSGINQKPQCSGCDKILNKLQYIPLYWRLCISKFCECGRFEIPIIYTLLELTVAIFAVMIYLLWGGESIARLILMPIMILTIFTFYHYKKLSENLIWLLACVGIFYATYNTNIDIFNKVLQIFTAFTFLKYLSKLNYLEFRSLLILFSICDNKSFIYIVSFFILSFIFVKLKLIQDIILTNLIFFAIFEFIIRKFL